MKRGKVACRAGLHCTLLLKYGAEFTFPVTKSLRGNNAKYEFKDIGTLFP